MTKHIEPYEILGVPRSASAAEIKMAWRRVAMELHPDRHQQKSAEVRAANEKKFKEAAAAYAALQGKAHASSRSRPSSPSSSNDRGEDEYQGSFESFISKIWRSSVASRRAHMCASAIKIIRKDPRVVTEAAGKELKTLLRHHGDEEGVQSLLDLVLDTQHDVIAPSTFASFVTDIWRSTIRNDRTHMCASAIKIIRKNRRVVTEAAGKELQTLLRHHGDEDGVQSLYRAMMDTRSNAPHPRSTVLAE